MQTGGGFPSGFNEILALPGIGRYTAGAICAIAYNQAQPAVDGNIRRVIARLMGLERGVPEDWFYRQATALIPPRKASSFTQAMMDLGATVCMPLQPLCPRCPVAPFCRSMKLGIQDRIPPPKKKLPGKHVRIAALLLQRSDRILLISPVNPGFIPGRLGLPSCLIMDAERPADAAVRLCRRILGRRIPLASCAKFRHGIGQRQIEVYGFSGKADTAPSRPREPGRFYWTRRSSSCALLTSSLFKKVIGAAGEMGNSRRAKQRGTGAG
jgi:A/G-specific adenine glycosylase